MPKKRIAMIGKKFNSLSVVSVSHQDKKKEYYYNCLCDCGRKSVVSGSKLRKGKTKSCGHCYAETNRINAVTKHGYSQHELYPIWHNMMARCYDVRNKRYDRYGGRGIEVCKRWHNVGNFISDMFPRPAYGLTLDRKDNEGNYSPENCRWATWKQQANNTSGNRVITFNGKSQTLTEWADEYGMPEFRLRQRLDKLNWSFSKAIRTPKLN